MDVKRLTTRRAAGTTELDSEPTYHLVGKLYPVPTYETGRTSPPMLTYGRKHDVALILYRSVSPGLQRMIYHPTIRHANH